MKVTATSHGKAPTYNFGTAKRRGWGEGWPNCQRSKMVTITLSNGVRITVRREIKDLIRFLLNECIRRGYNIRRTDTGSFNCRPINHNPKNGPSNHSWGLAVDVNWKDNGVGTSNTDVPPWMVVLMWKYGFYWGGWWTGSGRDPMHFEFVRGPADAAHLTTQLELDLKPKAVAPAAFTELTVPYNTYHYAVARAFYADGGQAMTVVRDNPSSVDTKTGFIKAGAVLRIRHPAFLVHWVAPGQTMIGIAKKHGKTLQQIHDMNHMQVPDANKLPVGTPLRISALKY